MAKQSRSEVFDAERCQDTARKLKASCSQFVLSLKAPLTCERSQVPSESNQSKGRYECLSSL